MRFLGRGIVLAGGLAWVAGFGTACGGGVDPAEPPDIVYGEDVCDQCGMIISDARYAAATIVEDSGRMAPRKFDDISDMFDYHRAHSDLTVRSWWVHDYETEAWIDATAAYYVHGEGIRSPMGGGLASFSTEAQALAFASTIGGTLVTFESLLAQEGDAAPNS